jgi:hypothetical protein
VPPGLPGRRLTQLGDGHVISSDALNVSSSTHTCVLSCCFSPCCNIHRVVRSTISQHQHNRNGRARNPLKQQLSISQYQHNRNGRARNPLKQQLSTRRTEYNGKGRTWDSRKMKSGSRKTKTWDSVLTLLREDKHNRAAKSIGAREIKDSGARAHVLRPA